MQVFYDAWAEAYKSPFGAVREDESVRIRVKVGAELSCSRVVLKLRRDGESAEREIPLTAKRQGRPSGAIEQYIIFEGAFSVGKWGLFYYRFEITTQTGILFVGRGAEERAVVGDFLPEWQLTVYERDFETPKGLDRGILYQIFPDRFCRGAKGPLPPVRNGRTVHKNWTDRPLFKADVPDYAAVDFFGGDLRGIWEKLPYLKSLGVTALYLNPIFEAASNHRYNTGDYRQIDPWLGTREDFASLCEAFGKEGIRVILDGVFSHTGSDSLYFNKEGHYDSVGAYQSKDSPYASWYRFTDKKRKEYQCWWGVPTLPNVNEDDASFESFICGEDGILAYWMKQGASGWRLDVADELPDHFLDEVRSRIKKVSPDAYLLGEVWEDASNKESYGARRRYLLGSQLDGVMNYPWRTALLDYIKEGDAELFYTRIMTILDHYPAPAIRALMNPLSTHDVARASTVFGVIGEVEGLEQGNYQPTEAERERGLYGLRLASILQYTLPGFPSLYYGDEAGMFGFGDPWNRRCYPWGDEDGELIAFFQKLGSIRQKFGEAMEKPLRFASHQDGAVAYWRGSLLIAVNKSDRDALVKLPVERGEILISVGDVRVGSGAVSLPPDSGMILSGSAVREAK